MARDREIRGVAEGSYTFCTRSAPFTIPGDTDCEARGFETHGFREEDIGDARSYTITLTKADAPKDATRKSTKSEARKAAPEPVPYDPLAQPDNGPGTYGEPLSIVATFRGCWATQEVIECEFHADGWRYIASEEGPTDLAIMDALQVFSDGSRLSVSGDLISYAGDRADIMIRDITPAPSQEEPITTRAPGGTEGLWDHLQGYWDSDTGDGYGWLVEDNRLREIYDANIIEEYYFEIHPHCAASGGRGPVIIGYPEIDPAMGPACFLVTETGPRHLAIINMGDGKAVSFSYSN